VAREQHLKVAARSHCRCRGGRVAVVAAVAVHAPHLLSACLASRSKTRVAVGYRGQQAPVRTPGRCTIEIGAMVLTTDAQGHPEW